MLLQVSPLDAIPTGKRQDLSLICKPGLQPAPAARGPRPEGVKASASKAKAGLQQVSRVEGLLGASMHRIPRKDDIRVYVVSLGTEARNLRIFSCAGYSTSTARHDRWC